MILYKLLKLGASEMPKVWHVYCTCWKVN